MLQPKLAIRESTAHRELHLQNPMSTLASNELVLIHCEHSHFNLIMIISACVSEWPHLLTPIAKCTRWMI